jgi:hypothetical protein
LCRKIMGDRKQIDFPFPLQGKNENFAYRKQPEGTTPDALNVRAYDAIANRQRGGQRNGLSKYLASAVNGSNAIQGISQLTAAFDPTSVIVGTSIGADEFAYTNGTKLGSVTASWTTFFSNADQAFDLEQHYLYFASTGSNDALVNNGKIDSVIAGSHRFGAVYSVIPTGTNYTIRATVNTGGYTGGLGKTFAFLLRCTLPTGNGYYAVEVVPDSASTATYRLTEYTGYNPNANNHFIRATFASVTLPGASTWATDIVFEVRVAGNLVRLYANGSLVADFSGTPILNYLSATSVGIGGGYQVGASGFDFAGGILRFEVLTAVVPASLRSTSLITVSGGTVYYGSSAALYQATNGQALITAGVVRMQQAFGKMYFVDGTNYKIYDPTTNAVTLWVPTVGSLPAGSPGTSYAITGVNIANSTFTIAATHSELTVGAILTVAGSTGNNGTYRIVSGGPTYVVSPAPVNATVDGTLGVAQRTCTMIALYRGRLVLSGLSSDPQDWFMSAAPGELNGVPPSPLNWNYTPAVITQTMAVAGNSSVAGLMGDVVTCLAPYNDDLLFIGGDHTLWVMRGDPAAGGLIDNISFQTGIVGPDAWARDPDGNFYFFGAGTLWHMTAGAWTPQPLSRGILDKTFAAIDYATYQVRLLWDDIAKGVHLYFTPANRPSSGPIHFFWDKRTGGFWPDQYPAVQGPTAVWNYDADLPTDRAMLLGGFDSYIRQIPAALARDDDGTPIHSYVRYGPQVIGGDLANSRLSELTPIMSSTSSPASLRVFAASSPEEVATATAPQVSRVLSAGRNGSLRQRITGNTIALELENVASTWVTATYYAAGVQVIQGGTLYTCLLPHTSGTFATDLAAAKWATGTTRSWAIESITGVVDVAGKVRHKRL